MIRAWVEYRLHLSALFSTIAVDEQHRLLTLLQRAEADWSLPQEASAEAEEPSVKARGVIWDGSRGCWRVRRQHGRSARVWGRLKNREDAEHLALAICAYERDNGHLPPAGWRG